MVGELSDRATGFFIGSRAQRLTASMIGEPMSCSLTIGIYLCAQRLTASMVGEPHSNSHASDVLKVLNALRHQWLVNVILQRSLGTIHKACSMPYGINGW